jgi:hypothetical protein
LRENRQGDDKWRVERKTGVGKHEWMERLFMKCMLSTVQGK